MKRYEGLLRPLSRPAPWPSRWVCVVTEGRPIPVTDRERIRQSGLSAWRACVVEMRGASPQCREYLSGNTAAGLWSAIAGTAGRSGPTWVISPRALYDWTLLGLWERLLLHDIAIDPSGPCRRRPKPDRGLCREPGMLLVGDPPSAAALLIGTEGRRITWTCARNFGWEIALAPDDPAEQLRLLVETITAATAALDRHNLGGWCPTVGAMAMRAWRSQHMGECLYVDERKEATELIREGSVGGRVQCGDGRRKADRAWHIDARGGYAHIGFVSDLPSGRRRYCHRYGAPPAALGERAKGCIARVHLRAGRQRYPQRTSAEVVYPSGPCETVLCGPELEDAIKLGLVSQIGEYCEYRMGSPLRSFQLACYQMRCEAESGGAPAVAAMAKALAVSLIGKLHSYSELWEECTPDYNDPICGTWMGPDGRGGTTEYRAVAGSVARKRRSGLSATAIPAVPLWVWSYGRLRLLDALDTAGHSETIYAHTDGLVVTEKGWDRLNAAGMIRDNEWGQLRYVAGPVECEVIGPYCVRIGDELIQPGAPRAQRGSDYAEKGYWYRAPFACGEGAYSESVWEERQREG